MWSCNLLTTIFKAPFSNPCIDRFQVRFSILKEWLATIFSPFWKVLLVANLLLTFLQILTSYSSLIMSYGNSWGAFFFNKLKQTPYIVPRLGEISHEGKLIEATKPWLRLKVFHVPTYESRLPEHYKRFYWLWKHGEKTPVHHIEDKSSFKLDKDKETVWVAN